MKHEVATLFKSSVSLLKQLISTPSFSREESETAHVIEEYMADAGLVPRRFLNNVWSCNKHFHPVKTTFLLNSHHDTVKPAKGYTIDPFAPIVDGGKLYGLGSNDAGGCLVTLLSVFQYFYEKDLPFNLVFAASAEEEISGKNGIEALLPLLPPIDAAIVGEPTNMQMAVAERGLLVLDVEVKGKAGHAARNEGENAIYRAMEDVNWFKNFRFEKVSPFLGPVKMTITSMETLNKAHNVVPDNCNFTVDVRINEFYSHEEILKTISHNLLGIATARSTRLKPSFIDEMHPLVMAGKQLGLTSYGSPTSSDMALMPFPSLKIGPGNSARSHMPNEFIYTEEIQSGLEVYISLLQNLADILNKES